MIIKPQRSTVFAWFFILSWIPAVIYLGFRYNFDIMEWVFIIVIIISTLVMIFTKAFSTYYLDYEGITQKCFFLTRHFYWKDFKYIGMHEMVGVSSTGRSWHIRCSTRPLPKNLTAKELQKKLYWPPSKTITIEWPEKGCDEFYREFLSYCGGERDIRD